MPFLDQETVWLLFVEIVMQIAWILWRFECSFLLSGDVWILVGRDEGFWRFQCGCWVHLILSVRILWSDGSWFRLFRSLKALALSCLSCWAWWFSSMSKMLGSISFKCSGCMLFGVWERYLVKSVLVIGFLLLFHQVLPLFLLLI